MNECKHERVHLSFWALRQRKQKITLGADSGFAEVEVVVDVQISFPCMACGIREWVSLEETK